MKNKKLFAILTLVCFMFTLMPVAAFAAEAGDGYVTVNTKDSVSVKAGEEIKFNVVDGNKSTSESYVYFALNEDGDVEDIYTTTTAKIKTPGVYEIYAVEAAAVSSIVSESALLTKAEKVELFLDNDTLVEEYAALTVKAVDAEYDIAISSVVGGTFTAATETANAKLSVTADGGYADVLLKAKVTTGDKNVKGVDVDFATNGYGVKINEVDSVTDRKGEVQFKVAATVAGEYKIYVSYEDAEEIIDLTVDPVGAAAIEVVAEPTAPVDVDTEAGKTGIGFKLYDVNGNVITGTNYTDLKVNVAAQPADSSLKAELNTGLTYDTQNNYWVLNTTKLAEEGNYSFMVTLPNGTTAMASVKVQEFDEAVAMKLIYNPATVGLGDTAKIAKLLLIDANGVQKNIVGAANIAKYGVELAANGYAVDTFSATTGDLKVKADEKYIGSTVTVFAVCDDLTATADIAVVEDAITLDFVNTTADVAVTNTLVANVVNADGKVVALNAADTPKANVIVLDKPENALAAVSAKVKNAQNNAFDITFTASATGEYKVQVVVTYTEGTGEAAVTRYISAIETITVGGVAGDFKDVVVVSMGANKMIVNNELVALDVAPFIENNRTMMQFNVLYVFGIDVKWVPETESIVAEGNGLKVVMNLGSKVAVVNGEEVALDVAPYSVNGRTVVPVGFITGLLDITPVFTYNADGTIADILFTK